MNDFWQNGALSTKKVDLPQNWGIISTEVNYALFLRDTRHLFEKNRI